MRPVPSSTLGLIEAPTVREVSHQVLGGFGHRLNLAEHSDPVQARIPSCPPLCEMQQCSASPRTKALRIYE